MKKERQHGEPAPSWVDRLDLNRTLLVRDLVDGMERCLMEAEAAAAALRQVEVRARQADFSKGDVAAMKKIARLRVKDQVGRAQEQLAALHRMSRAVDCDLFTWSAVSTRNP